MGSSCSILNDTKHDVWITHGINWPVLIDVVSIVVGVFSLGAGAVASELAGLTGAEAEAGCFGLTGGGELIYDAEGIATGELAPVTLAGLTSKGWTRLSIVLALTDASLAKILNVSQGKAEEIKRNIRTFQASAKRITPGNKYTWYGTLSLTMRVYCMNDMTQFDDRGCFTGWYAGSENVYRISEYFQKLKVN